MNQTGQNVSAEIGTFNDVAGNQQNYNLTIYPPTSPEGDTFSNDRLIKSGIYAIVNDRYDYSLSDSSDKVVGSSTSDVEASVFYIIPSLLYNVISFIQWKITMLEGRKWTIERLSNQLFACVNTDEPTAGHDVYLSKTPQPWVIKKISSKDYIYM